MATPADGTGRKGAGTSDIEPPMLQAANRGLNTITGADQAWMGPGQPMQAVVPNAAGRQYDYPVATNLNIRPRSGEANGFADLRALADAYYLVRLAIETRKDQLVKVKWTVKPADDKIKPDNRCKDLITFFKKPDQRRGWQDWLRMLIEDLLVIDAPTLYYHENYGNKPYAFEIIDGATIKVLVDQYGRTPTGNDAAYQQNIKGIPTVNYTVRELVYKPRNPRSWKQYGYSPVEQIIMIVNVGLRRTISQLQFYTEGNIPEALITTPNTWNPDQIKTYQAYWDSLFEGDTGSRRHAKFVPGGMDIHETKAATLTDAFDEWLARVVQYCFSLPATPYLKQVNKGETTNMKEQAEEEGLAPIMIYVADYINNLISTYWGYDDIEFSWIDEKAIDPLVQAQIDQIYTVLDVVDKNEVRATLGLEARDYAAEALEKAKANPANDSTTGAPLPPQVAAPPPAAAVVTKKAGHTHGLKKKTYAKLSRTNVARAKNFAASITDYFDKIKPGIIKQLVAAYDKSAKVHDSAELRKSAGDDISADLTLDFTAILNVSTKQLTAAAREGAEDAKQELDGRGDPFDPAAIAAGVGEYNAGELIKGLDPATRDMIAGDINEAFTEGWSTSQLAGKLEDNYAFSEGRASTIARTEVAFADSTASMKAYRESSVVTGKKVLLAENPCEICQENANDGIIDLDEDFSSGDDTSPFHPNCECAVSPVIGNEDNQED